MIKIVYVYIGGSEDMYYKMLQISLASLRRHMPQIEVNIVCDSETQTYFTRNHLSVLSDANISLLVAEIPSKYTQVEASRYLKTNLRTFVKGDFIFLDCDTVVCTDFSNLQLTNSVGMVLDLHRDVSEMPFWKDTLKEKAELRELDYSALKCYFNSGVMLVKDNEDAHQFFTKWFECWEHTRRPQLHQDQFAMNYVDIELNAISEVDKSWNFQTYALANVVTYLSDAKVIHYFSAYDSGSYLLNDSEILKLDINSEEIQNIIEQPHHALKAIDIYPQGSFEWLFLRNKIVRLQYRFYRKIKRSLKRRLRK